AVRLDRVQHLPAANGGRCPQAHAAPGPVFGPSLWIDARIVRTIARTNPPRAGVTMNVRVRLFARARELGGGDAVLLSLTEGATVADLRRQLAVVRPTLAGLLERCAVAVNDEFAEDTLSLPREAEVALLPPVSGGG